MPRFPCSHWQGPSDLATVGSAIDPPPRDACSWRVSTLPGTLRPSRPCWGSRGALALDRGAPNRAAFDQLSALTEARLCDGHAVRDREMARACLAALWLYHDFLDESHRISQSLHGREGSYWHGIMHRREGDYANAKYWFRRVGAHPIHEALGLSARALAQDARRRR